MNLNCYEVDESDCCGNGCANCILDANKFQSDPNAEVEFNNKINCLNKNRFYELLLIEYAAEPDIIKLKFQLKDQPDITESIGNATNMRTTENNLILYVPPGHHIMMKNLLYCRPYTPYWIDIKKFQFKILVNLRPKGIMSQYIKEMKLGDLVEFKGPIGTFYHEINKYEHLLIFTNGIAVTSVIRIIEEILNNEDDMTRIHYFGCFTNFENFYFRKKFLEYKQFWNFSGKIYMAREKCQIDDCVISNESNNKNNISNMNGDGFCEHFKQKIKYGEKIFNFKLNNEEIRKNLKIFNLDKINIVICGSKIFENFIKTCLENYKINTENINVL